MGNIEQSVLSAPAPLEYWESCDARQGGVLGYVSEKSLFIHSHVEMRIGSELRMAIFFSSGSGFDSFEIMGKIAGKNLCCVEGWEAYEYEIEFFAVSDEGRHKLREFLRNRQERKS